jgi:hypothetical protein
MVPIFLNGMVKVPQIRLRLAPSPSDADQFAVKHKKSSIEELAVQSREKTIMTARRGGMTTHSLD